MTPTDLPPLTLYVHIPFCVRKCPYCDFHSIALPEIPERRYRETVQQELRWRRQLSATDGRPLQAVFFGGGTPSMVEPSTIEGILQTIADHWSLVADCEITLEANPESATLDKMRAWRQAGVQRLSLGIQAFDEARLQFLGRPHGLEEARQAIRHAQRVDFAALNLDLIYATPGQTVAQWRQELAEAMEWAPPHLSCYQLSVEPGTPFFARQGAWPPLAEEQELALFQQTRQQLAQGGWRAYETSNFAQPGFACRHNSNYWSFGDYLGVGSGAHGKWTAADGGIWRSENPPAVADYLTRMAGAPPAERMGRLLEPAEAGREVLLMGLRHAAGVERALYRRLTGFDLLERHAELLRTWQGEGWVCVDAERVCLTERGIPLTDSLLLALW
ncbi:MAG: radical SAM family heme chaperone HemW [Magnetococcus sp. MYC-9]